MPIALHEPRNPPANTMIGMAPTMMPNDGMMLHAAQNSASTRAPGSSPSRAAPYATSPTPVARSSRPDSASQVRRYARTSARSSMWRRSSSSICRSPADRAAAVRHHEQRQHQSDEERHAARGRRPDHLGRITALHPLGELIDELAHVLRQVEVARGLPEPGRRFDVAGHLGRRLLDAGDLLLDVGEHEVDRRTEDGGQPDDHDQNGERARHRAIEALDHRGDEAATTAAARNQPITRVDECTTTRAMRTTATTTIASTIEREPIRTRSAPRSSGGSCESGDIRSYSTAVAAAPEGTRPPRGIRQIEFDAHTYVVLGLTIGGAYMLLALFTTASRTFTWLVIGTLLALALDPLVGAVQRRFRVGRRNAVGVVFGGFLVFAVGAGALLVPRAVDQAQNFSSDVPKVIDSIGTLPIIGGRLRAEHVPERVQTWFEELPQRLGGDPRRSSSSVDRRPARCSRPSSRSW